MGLDASVRCRCWEDGLATAPPCPVRLDRDGWLERASTDGSLEDDLVFDAWLENACEHDSMQLAGEYIGDWSSYRAFRDAVQALPTLARVLPEKNGGSVSPGDAIACLAELAAFEQADPGASRLADVIRPLRVVLAASARSGNPVRWC